MRSDGDASPLADLLHNIELAEQFIRGVTFDEFRDDLMRVYAAVRCLEIISEASRRLSNALKERHPGIPWREVAGAGNIYRHDYEDVAATRIWATIRVAPPPLRAVVEQELGDA
jgi:uncharacterized protein with HEPN domain